MVYVIIFGSCSNHPGEKPAVDTDKAVTSLSAEQLSRKWCTGCHVFPSPELLDKNNWDQRVLPQMGYRLGIYKSITRDSLIEKGIASSIINKAGVFPANQLVSNEEWEMIRQFFLDRAPDSLPMTEWPKVKKRLTTFKVIQPKAKQERPFTTAIEYDQRSRLYFLANSQTESSKIKIYDSNTESLVELGMPLPISQMAIRSDTLWVLMMGHLVPSDEPAGALVKAFKGPDGTSYKGGGFSLILNRLQRPVHVTYSDLDQNGQEDILVCEFGNHTGGLSLYLKEGNQKYSKKLINPNPGAIRAKVVDINNDSHPDIVALMAQGDEGIDIYYNQGSANFERERVLRFPPSYGSMSFSLVDFNHDGYLDILYVNGDNGDYSQILKPYHGIRVYLNDGTNHFNESFFFHQNGAYKAIAGDFDQDGDLDIASISFFPDFLGNPEEGFIYLENESIKASELRFTPSTFAGSGKARWITMNTADIDHDGDDDLLLGSFTGMEIIQDSTRAILDELIKSSPPFLILENTTNSIKP